MIPGLEPVAPNSIGFLMVVGAMTLLAWSPWRKWFAQAMALAGLAVVATWLQPLDVLALIGFLAIPYFSAATSWGRKEVYGGTAVVLVLIWQILLFLVIKRYAWFDLSGYLDHPVAVIGVSYILFRQIHLIVDAPYFGHLPFGVVRYLAYTLSPWTLIAGPIQRYEAFCKGLGEVSRPDTAEVRAQGHRIVNGLIKAFLIAPLFLEPSRVTTLALADASAQDFLVVLYAYPIYIYLNFSGYVDIVIGAARLAGFTTLPENFNRPWLARNPADFWTRWHMSFGIWVRHYVFMPLSTHLVKRVPAHWGGAMMALAVLVTFYLVGAWHGTTLHYVAFGLMQGVGVVIASGFAKVLRRHYGNARCKQWSELPAVRWGSIFLCFHFICATIIVLNNSLEDVARSFGVFLY